MIAVNCAAKAILVTLIVFILALALNLMLLGAGVPIAYLPLVWAVGMTAVARFVAKECLESERSWLWAAGGFVLGLLVVPGLVFAYEWDQAGQHARIQAGGDWFAVQLDLEPPHNLSSIGYAGSRERLAA